MFRQRSFPPSKPQSVNGIENKIQINANASREHSQYEHNFLHIFRLYVLDVFTIVARYRLRQENNHHRKE